MNKDFTADDYRDTVNFIVNKLVGRSFRHDAEADARQLLQNVVQHEAIYSHLHPIMQPTYSVAMPSYEDVVGV